MDLTTGVPDIAVALIDGPVGNHPDLAVESIRRLSGETGPATPSNGVALAHGTYVAGILAARRGSGAPAICPACTLLVRPVFLDTASNNAEMPSVTPDEVADAVAECVDAGARVVNLSIAVPSPSSNKEKNWKKR